VYVTAAADLDVVLPQQFEFCEDFRLAGVDVLEELSQFRTFLFLLRLVAFARAAQDTLQHCALLQQFADGVAATLTARLISGTAGWFPRKVSHRDESSLSRIKTRR